MHQRRTLPLRPMAVLVAATVAALISQVGLHATPVSGAIFTTDYTCLGVDLNIYGSLLDVYLDGGPAHPGAAGLPDGDYAVKITEPDGQTLLGTSVGTINSTPIHVVNGEFDQCYKLWDYVIKASDGSIGYDATANPGGEYKVWVSPDTSFPTDTSKTDNFKVPGGGGSNPQTLTLTVDKFYDANADGIRNGSEPLISGWKVLLTFGSLEYIRFTHVAFVTQPEDYTVTEFMPIETNWVRTTPSPVNHTVGSANFASTLFGNVCLGAGGGLTLGFWSNKNGQALVGSDDLSMLVGLNLVDAIGSPFNPATYSAFRTWLLGATATNMSYMLSAQLAAMELNVYNGRVNGAALVYAPGVSGANAAGFISVNGLMSQANTWLGSHPSTPSGDGGRAYAELLKNALDRANNDQNFAQAAPCAFNFPPD